jgi:hypothetical protein
MSGKIAGIANHFGKSLSNDVTWLRKVSGSKPKTVTFSFRISK